MTDSLVSALPDWIHENDGLVWALARAQSKFPPIVKSHDNPAYRGSQYADIADVLAVVRPVLASEGLVVTQPLELTETSTVLVTRLMYGAEVLESRMVLPIEGLDAQRFGSWLTYARRYCLCALLGVHPENDDDDGNTASAAPPQRQPAPVEVSLDKPLTDMSVRELNSAAQQLGHTFTGAVSKAEMVRQLEPLWRARNGDEPFDLAPPENPPEPNPDPQDVPFQPVVADGPPGDRMRNTPGSIRQQIRRAEK